MKIIPSKSILRGAIAGAILATGLMSTPSFAAPGDVSPNGVGGVLLFPYYTTQNNFQTLIHLVNTSSDTVIAKVRFRDYADSKDAMDFTVILSPNDVFSGYVKDIAGTTTFVKTDNTCTSPIAANNQIPFPSSTQDTKKHAGHIEVIVEGTMSNATAKNGVLTVASPDQHPDTPAFAANEFVRAAEHNSSGNPANCATVDQYFRADAGTRQRDIDALQVAGFTNAASDVISGHFVVQDASGGVSGGGRAVALIDTVLAVQNASQPCGASGSPTADNLICGQFPAHYPFPNLMNIVGTVAAGNAPGVGSNSDIVSLMEGQLAGAFLNMNEWSAIASNGVTSEMPVTQPLKYIHRDKEPATLGVDSNTFFNAGYTTTAGAAGTSATDANLWDNVDSVLQAPQAAVAHPAANVGAYDASGCISYNLNLYDREEQNGPSAGTSASGAAGPQTGKFCNETTVVTFAGGITKAAGTGIAATYDTLNKATGTARVNLQNTAGSVPAVIGYSMWKRSFGSTDKNFSHLMPNM